MYNGLLQCPSVQLKNNSYGKAFCMFHVTWTTFKFNTNQLGTVSAFVMISESTCSSSD